MIDQNNIISEEALRPAALMAQKMSLTIKDRQKLLKQAGDFIRVDCPACGLKDSELVFDKDGFYYEKCAACQTMFINPRPTEAILEEWYKTSEHYAFWNRYIFPATEENRRKSIYIPRIDRLLQLLDKLNVERGTLMEVGAGFGTFIEEISRRKIFKRTLAVEPTPDLADTIRKKNVEVIASPIEKIDIEAFSADVIVSFEVIEHLFAPGKFIQACGKLLKKGGVLILSCPNYTGFDMTVLGKRSNSFDSEHLNYFTPQSLSLLVTKQGLKIIETLTPGKLDADIVRNRALSGEIDLSSQPFLQRILLDQWDKYGAKFQDFLAENNLSSHLWLAAGK